LWNFKAEIGELVLCFQRASSPGLAALFSSTLHEDRVVEIHLK